jgi:hypothetical protein
MENCTLVRSGVEDAAKSVDIVRRLIVFVKLLCGCMGVISGCKLWGRISSC